MSQWVDRFIPWMYTHFHRIFVRILFQLVVNFVKAVCLFYFFIKLLSCLFKLVLQGDVCFLCLCLLSFEFLCFPLVGVEGRRAAFSSFSTTLNC